MNHIKFCLLPGLLFLFTGLTNYGQSKQQVDNEIAFVKLYGYVKYFHPSDEAALVDWDRFAIYGSRKVENCKSKKELVDTLRALFGPIAPTVQIYQDGEKVTFNKDQLIPPELRGYKTIAWQHSGVGLGDQRKVYKSARTNRPIISKHTAEFAPLSKFLDAARFRNKEFIFRARVRMSDGNGSGHLWARVDKLDHKMGFFDNMDGRPIQNKEWSTYEIKGKVDSDAALIFIGAFLAGQGELWLDDMSLQVKEDDQWREVYVNTFSQEENGQSPKSININNALAAYSYSVLKEQALKDEYYVSIKSIEDAVSKEVKHTTLFKEYPEVGEYVNRSLGAGIKAIIPIALYGTSEQTYPASPNDPLEQLIARHKAIPSTEINGSNLYCRLGDIIITWNIFQHFFPYFEIAKTDWHADLENSLRRAYTDKTESDFQKNLEQLTAKLKDGHIRVSLSNNRAVYLPPFSWEWIEGQLVITNVLDTSVHMNKGDLVSSINGRKPGDYFADINQSISAATKGWLNYRAQTESLLGEKGSVLNLEIEKPGNISTISLKRTLTFLQFNAARPSIIKMIFAFR